MKRILVRVLRASALCAVFVAGLAAIVGSGGLANVDTAQNNCLNTDSRLVIMLVANGAASAADGDIRLAVAERQPIDFDAREAARPGGPVDDFLFIVRQDPRVGAQPVTPEDGRFEAHARLAATTFNRDNAAVYYALAGTRCSGQLAFSYSSHHITLDVIPGPPGWIDVDIAGKPTGPADVRGPVGFTAIFPAPPAFGDNTYQWESSADGGVNYYPVRSGGNVIASDDSLQVVGATLADNGKKYRLRVTNRAEPSLTLVSRAATLTVDAPAPVLTVAQLDVYAPHDLLNIQLQHAGEFAGPVALEFDAMGSGITGGFAPNPAPGDISTLNLALPARYGAGGMVPLRIRGTVAGTTVTRDFTQHIAPLFAFGLSPTSAVLTAARPLDVALTLSLDEFGPFGLLGIGRVELTAPDLPPGVTAQFLPDAAAEFNGLQQTVTRTMRLITDGSSGATGVLQVRASARGLGPDAAGEFAYIEVPLQLQVQAEVGWTYINNGASLGALDAQTVGIALQASAQPLVAWIEDQPDRRKVYLSRYDGVLWAPWPTSGAPLAEAVAIDEAALALANDDTPAVAYVYRNGLGQSLLNVGRADSAWTKQVVTSAGAATLRSPRIAAGNSDALTVAYIQEAGASAGSGLFVARKAANGSPFVALAGLNPDGSINRDVDGRVLRDTPALAVAAGGDPVLAWIEQPADAGRPAALWLRRFTGGAWGPAIAVPTGGRPLSAAPVQIAIGALDLVYVAWLESTPARLMATRFDPATTSWSPLADQANPDGALNVGGEPARDVSLAIDALGNHVVIAWAEGALKPRLWAKQRQSVSWGLLGTTIDPSGYAMRRPRAVVRTDGTVLVEYSRFRFLNDDLSTPNPQADIFVARLRP